MNRKFLSLSLSAAVVLSSLAPLGAANIDVRAPRVHGASPVAVSGKLGGLQLISVGPGDEVLKPEASQDLLDLKRAENRLFSARMPARNSAENGALDADNPADALGPAAESPLDQDFAPGDAASPSQVQAAAANPNRRAARALGVLRRVFSRAGVWDGVRQKISNSVLAAPGFAPHDHRRGTGGWEWDLSPFAPDERHLPSPNVKLFGPTRVPTPSSRFSFDNEELPANAEDAAGIERSLRDLLDRNPGAGISSRELDLVGVDHVPGDAGRDLADTWYAVFRQRYLSRNADGSETWIPVYGASLSWTLKRINGRLVVKNLDGKLYSISVDANQEIGDAQLEARVKDRLKKDSKESHSVRLLGRQIVYVPKPQTLGARVFNFLRFYFGGKTLGASSRAAALPAGSWRAVNLYKIDGVSGGVAAADVATGDIFLWDMGARSRPPDQSRVARPKTAASGRAQFEGRAPMSDHDMGDPPKLSQNPAPLVTVRLSDGREITADENGRVRVDLPDGRPIKTTARLQSSFVSVVNKAGDPVEASVSLVANGGDTVVVFNPPPEAPERSNKRKGLAFNLMTAALMTVSPALRAQKVEALKAQVKSDLILAQVNAYLSAYRFMMWCKAHGIGVKDGIWDPQYVVNVNIDQSCNAYMDPADNLSRNFFQKGVMQEKGAAKKIKSVLLGTIECINTGTLPGVFFHESGHLVHFAVAGRVGGASGVLSRADPVLLTSVDGGLSEGIGDTFATFMLDTPWVGEHFFLTPGKPYLRSAENNYQYNPDDEVHTQAGAWSGTAWDTFQNLIPKLGKEAAKAAAEALVFPNIYGYALTDIPGAARVIYLAAMKTDGSIHEDLGAAVRQAALRHGMDPAAPPDGSETTVLPPPTP